LLAPPRRLRQRRTARVVIILDLAIQALKTFRRDDLAGRGDRPHRTRPLAQMARIAAFWATLEQVDQVQSVKERQYAAERTQEGEIGAWEKHPDRQQNTRVEHIGPSAGELGGNRSLERLDLGGGARGVDSSQYQRQHSHGGNVLAHP